MATYEDQQQWPRIDPALADASTILTDVLEARGVLTARDGDTIVLPALGLRLGVVAHEAVHEARGIKTVSTIVASHSRFPDGLLEYQHSLGESASEALRLGFEAWAGSDFEVIKAVASNDRTGLMHMDLTLPAESGLGEHKRTLVFGPPTRVVAAPDSSDLSEGLSENLSGDSDAGDEGSHEFCPCCLTTNCFEALASVFGAHDVVGLRLFAMRDETGEIGADCRINGDDFPAGVEALKAYAATWRGNGFEFRKQYVIVFSPEVEK